MSTSAQDAAPSTTTTVSTPTSSGSSSSSSPSSRVQMKRSLVGQPLDVQLSALAPVQRAEDPAAVHEAAAAGIASGGGAMPHAAAIQQSFGAHDIGNVQAHTGSGAAQATQAMGAEAYASGNHVVFGGAPDLHTAAHEAAHVVQQQAGVSLSGGVGQVGDKYEQHADQVADAVVQGKSAEGLLDTMSGGGASVQRSVQRHVARMPVQMNPTATPTGPVRTAETPSATEVPGGQGQVDARNSTTPATQPKVKWRKVVDRGRVAWYVVLEPVTPAPTTTPGGSGTPPAPTTGGDYTTDIHPDQAFSLAQDPVAEAAADTFEQSVGNFAMGHTSAKNAAAAIASQAVAMAEAYVTAMEAAGAAQAEMDMSFQKLLGGFGPTWAGSCAVPIPDTAPNKAKLAKDNVARIRAVAASGNVREMVNLAVSFLYAFSPTVTADLEAGRVEMATFATEAKTKVGTLDTGVTDFTASITKQIAEKSKWVSVVADDPAVSSAQGSSRTKGTNADDKSQRKVESLGAYAQLSENEKLVMFGDAGTTEKTLKEQHLTWSEGRKVWFINEGDKFVQQCRDASVPLGGGVSGTTGRIMECSRVFNTGAAPVDMRAAAIGYLLPIRAHTLIEVMKGAEPFGAGAVPSPPSFAIYANIEPFGAMTSLHPSPAFTKLVEQTQKKTGTA